MYKRPVSVSRGGLFISSELTAMIEENISLIDNILRENENFLGDDHEGYKNHVYRMVNFCLAQRDLDDEAKEKIVIAGCFHDLGIWSGDTFDYLPPSIQLANEYLTSIGCSEWIPEIARMIGLHHRLRAYPDKAGGLIEIFRKGDLVDFSLGIFRCGIPSDYIRAVKQRFPNAGFHRKLVGLGCGWLLRHPLNPVPVLKW